MRLLTFRKLKVSKIELCTMTDEYFYLKTEKNVNKKNFKIKIKINLIEATKTMHFHNITIQDHTQHTSTIRFASVSHSVSEAVAVL